MPAAAPITLGDGASTPVVHTFSPIGKDAKGVITYEQTVPTVSTPLEAKKLSYRQVRGTMAGSKVNGQGKFVLTVVLPRAEAVSNAASGFTPPPSLAYELKARIELDLPERSTMQERKDLRALVSNAMAFAAFGPQIDSLQAIY